MATTTTNYGWTVPTSSDLVKNGATAISTLGQSVDTFLFRPFSKNAIINGGFDIWQRGTSIAVAASTIPYTADRWGVYCSPSNALTISRQLTNDTTNLPFIQYCMRFQRNNGQTGTGGLNLVQSMETTNSIPFAGKTVTLSFYARKGVNYSATSDVLKISLISGTGTDQNRNGAAYTGEAYPINSQSATLTTTWQRFSFTGTVASNATELSFYSNYDPTGTAGANDYFEITGVQLEVGSTATPFSRNAPSYGLELQNCQRYYYRIANGQAYSVFGAGAGSSATVVRVAIPTHTTMRVYPTSVDYSGVTAWDYAGGAITFTSLALANLANNPDNPQIDITGSGITTHRPYYLVANNNTSAYVGLSAEL